MTAGRHYPGGHVSYQNQSSVISDDSSSSTTLLDTRHFRYWLKDIDWKETMRPVAVISQGLSEKFRPELLSEVIIDFRRDISIIGK
jgi:hypothetical protein